MLLMMDEMYEQYILLTSTLELGQTDYNSSCPINVLPKDLTV